MRVSSLLNGVLITLITVVVSETTTSTSDLDLFKDWTIKDFTEFLKDRKISIPSIPQVTENVRKVIEGEEVEKEDDTNIIDESANYLSQLKDLTLQQYESLKSQFESLYKEDNKIPFDYNINEIGQQILNVNNKDLSGLDILPDTLKNYGYLFHEDKSTTNKVKDWIFDSWPLKNLIYFSYNNKLIDSLDYNHKTSISDEFINKIKQNYDSITKQKDVAGNYPGDWLFELWSYEDFQNWLNKYEIPFDEENDTRSDLLKKVKDYSYLVSKSIKESKDSLYESLNINTNDWKQFSKSYVSKAGEFNDQFWNLWTYSQLREWLYYNGIIDKKPSITDEKLTREKLLTLIKSRQSYLKDDIQKYLSTANNQIKSTSDDVDTLLLHVNKWSKDKLRQFLELRGVKVSSWTSKHDLIEYVKAYRDKEPILDESSYSWLYDSLSTESIIEWLKSQGASVEGTRQELIDKFNESLTNSYKSSKQQIEDAQKNLPDITSFQAYLKKAYPKKKFNQKSIDEAYDLVSYYYNTVSDSILNNIEGINVSTEKTWKTLEKESFDFAADLLQTQKSLKSKLDENYKLAKDQAQLSSDKISKSLIDQYNKQTSKLSKYFKKLSNHFQTEKNNLGTLVKTNKKKEVPPIFKINL
ncbi:hypothetical protein DFJ63DRAFT_314996 [Scheffersomyces coipomensis]|uniref:uncharacterized protein n=1 Tax=Scheffersomyces coipomensis TaxID=1788519 RepID=UPI00315C9BC6